MEQQQKNTSSRKKMISAALEGYGEMMKSREVMRALAISERTFYELQASGELPDCIVVGRQKRWLKGVIAEYLEARWCRAAAAQAAVERGRKGAAARYGVRKCTRKNKQQLIKEREEGLRLARQRAQVRGGAA